MQKYVRIAEISTKVTGEGVGVLVTCSTFLSHTHLTCFACLYCTTFAWKRYDTNLYSASYN